MIFVTVGVQLPFDRLIQTMDAWAGHHPDVVVIAQTGVTSFQCCHMQAYRWLEGREFQQFVEQAELIVAHAGMGSILTALELGKPIIVLPRDAALGEHRNDHQAATSRYMAQANLVRVANDTDDLLKLVAQRHRIEPRTISTTAQPSLVEAISHFIQQDKSQTEALPLPANNPTLARRQAQKPWMSAQGSAQKVSVILPHYNDLRGLEKCMEALRKQSVMPSEILVCDNGSTCGSAEIERVCGPTAKVIVETERGAAAARNAGVRLASGTILAFLDSDCVPHDDWLQAGCKALAAADLVGGAMTLSFEDGSHRTAVEAFEAQFAFPNQRYVEKEHFSVTANMFVPRAIFEAVGAFRAGVPEDKDWGQRAHRLGYRWTFSPDAIVVHPARRTWAELLGKWQRLTKEGYAHAPHRGLFLLRSWVVVLSLPVFAVPLLWSKRLSGWRERLNAALILLRLRLWRLGECHRLVFSQFFAR